MTSEFIGRGNNYIPPTYLNRNEKIPLKFGGMVENILERWMETKIQY